MPATIGDILQTKPELITTTAHTLLYDALELMIRSDYSQLPVVDPTGKPIGILTSDSIMRALHHFGSALREPKNEAEKARHLRVRDAMFHQVEACSPEDEVFAVHRKLRDVSGVLVVDDSDKLVSIVTGYDTTEYLRQRVQDIVFVQDIEETIKDYVRLAFRRADGTEDEVALKAAVTEVAHTNSGSAHLFKQMLGDYLQAKIGVGANVDEDVADQIILKATAQKKVPEFEDLPLSSYIQLFLKQGLQRYGQVFQLDRKAIFPMLDSVRETRNDLAHLRIDISARQRDELRFCRDWLKHYYDDAKALVLPHGDATATVVAPESLPQITPSSETVVDVGDDATTVVVDETTVPGESRYTPLADWLYGLAADQARITLAFGQIEQIIGAKLPQSAREYRSWWANDTSRHRQSEQWLSAGWRTDDVDVARGIVTFSRILARERAYIDFFAALTRELRRVVTFPIFEPTKVGYYWQTIAKMPDHAPYAGYTTFSFTRARRPRVDLYIQGFRFAA